VLESQGARRFLDEYLQFAIDASRVSWVMTANELSRTPEPLLDRLMVINLPAITDAPRRVVLAVLMACIRERRDWRCDAMMRAAAEEHRAIDVTDVTRRRANGAQAGFLTF